MGNFVEQVPKHQLERFCSNALVAAGLIRQLPQYLGCAVVKSKAAVKHNILLMGHEAPSALPVAYLDSAQTASADPCEGRPQAVQWVLTVS